MFWRSFTDFEGLSSDEVLARLFFWYFAPSFGVFFLVPPVGSAEALTGIGYLGVPLTALVVWRDAQRARIERPWAWAALAGLVPLVGWWVYGRRRASPHAHVTPTYAGRASPLVRYVHPFWRTRFTLVTHLSPDECAARLNDLCVHWTSPRQWFSVEGARPVQGKANQRGFSLKWRHALTRPGGLPEASGRFEERAGATVVRLWVGMSVFDGMFFVLWLAVTILVGLPMAIMQPSGAPPGFGLFWFSGWVGIGLLVFTTVRWISSDDDVRLRRLIIEALEAEEIAN